MSAGMCVLPRTVQQLELRFYRYNVWMAASIHLPIETQQSVVLGISKKNLSLRRVDMNETWVLTGYIWRHIRT